MPLGAVRGLGHWCGGNIGFGEIAGDQDFFLWRNCLCFGSRRGWFREGLNRFRGCNRWRRGGLCRDGCCDGRNGLGSCNRGRGWRLDGCRLLGSAGMSFANGLGRWRLDHRGYCGRRNGDNRTRDNHGACRSLGYNWADGRARGNGRRRRDNDRRRGAGLGNNLARFRTSRRHGLRRLSDHGRRWPCRDRRRRRYGWLYRHMAVPRYRFVFLLFGQDSL
jgi:hypothetical protein